MLNASLCDNKDAYILAEGRMIITGQGADAVVFVADRNGKEVFFKNCAPFIDYRKRMTNAKLDNAMEIDIVGTNV